MTVHCWAHGFGFFTPWFPWLPASAENHVLNMTVHCWAHDFRDFIPWLPASAENHKLNTTVHCWSHGFRDVIPQLPASAALSLRRGSKHGVKSRRQRLLTSEQSGSREREDTRNKNMALGNSSVTYFQPLTFYSLPTMPSVSEPMEILFC